MKSRTRFIGPSSTPRCRTLGLSTKRYPKPAATARKRIILHAVTEGSNESSSKSNSKKSNSKKSSSKKMSSKSPSSEKITITRAPVVTRDMINTLNPRRTFRLGNPIKGLRNISRRIYRLFSKTS